MGKGVTVTAKLLGGRSIKSDATGIKSDIKGIGTEVQATDQKAGQSASHWDLFTKRTKAAGDEAKKTGHSFSGMAKGIVGAAAGFGAGFVGISTIKSSLEGVKTTSEEIRKAQALGFSGTNQEVLDTLSAYKARGIGLSALAMSAKGIAKATHAATEEEEKYTKAQEKAASQNKPLTAELGSKAKLFQQLGINTQRFAALSGSAQLKEIGDVLTKMPAGPERTRIAVELLGRNATTMLPLFRKGAEGIGSMEKAAKAFLPDLKGGAKGLEEINVKQAEFSLATEGLKLRIGMALLPEAVKLMGTMTKLFANISHGTGVFGKLASIIKSIAPEFKNVYEWISHNKGATDALVGVLGLLGAALVASKVKTMALVVADGLSATWKAASTAATVAWTVATWAADAAETVFIASLYAADIAMAILTSPITLVVAGLALLGLAVYEVVTHFKFFEHIAQKVFGWLKGHWPLLLPILFGPFGVAALLIIKNFNTILHFVTGMPQKLKSVGIHMWDFIKESFRNAIDWILKGWNRLHFKMPGVSTPFGHIGGFDIGLPHIPLLAAGGNIVQSGSAIVGERGPELLTLPRGAQVSPLKGDDALGQVGQQSPFRWGSDGLHVHVEISGREVGHATLNNFLGEAARAYS